jgi:signal transduction histidine kinase/HAMP domain-containing protein
MKKSEPYFRGSVLAELVSRTLFVGILILFIYGGFAYFVSNRTFDTEMGDRLLTIAHLTSSETQADWLPFLGGKGELYEKFQSFLRDKKKESQAKNIFIMDSTGRVLVDANGQYEFKENNWLKDLDSEPFLKAVSGIPSASILFPERDGGIYKVGYSPIYKKNKEIIGVLGVEASAKYMEGLNQFAKVLFISGLFCLLLMGGLNYAFGRRFISPIEEMARASFKIAEGDFSQRVRFSSSNELGALAHAFNEMAKRLQSHNEYILESMSNGLLVVDLNGYVTTFNRAASIILDLPQEKVIGQPYGTVFSAYPFFLKTIRAALLEQQQSVDKEVNLSEESPKFLRLRSAPLLGAEGQKLGTEILFSDETELRKLQTQIKTSEKMATIGELAAGIAHEIRNPLGAMKGFTEILARKIDKNIEAKEIVKDIATEIEILNKIVTNFLIFAKPTILDMQEAEIGEVILGVLPLVDNEAQQKKIRLTLIKTKEILIRLDVEQFRRAVLNLTLNAIHASPVNGEIVLGVKEFNRAELMNYLKDKGFQDIFPNEIESNWCGIWVADEGSGIQKENLKKIFNPFFTTKTEGFGLGLSITKKILESMGGNIAVTNKPDRGAIFLMILPMVGLQKEAKS